MRVVYIIYNLCQFPSSELRSEDQRTLIIRSAGMFWQCPDLDFRRGRS